MESLFNIIGIFTAGVATTFGFVSFGINYQDKNEKVYLIFSIMSLTLAIYSLIPPFGFIINDIAPYSIQIEIKRIFIFSYYASIPLFIAYYTGYKKPYIIYANLSVVILAYLLMILTKKDQQTPPWVIFAFLSFLIIALLGIKAGFWQLKNGNRKDAILLLAVMAIFCALYILVILHQFFGYMQISTEPSKLFYPFHLHSIFFFLIIGIRLYEKSYDKIKLIRLSNVRSIRWNMFLQNLPLITVEIDEDENVLFINKHGLNTFGFSSSEKFDGKNVTDLFKTYEDKKRFRQHLNSSEENSNTLICFKSTFIGSDGQPRSVIWLSFLVDSEDKETMVKMLIGRDITKEEVDHSLIKKLELEIEKENILKPDTRNLVLNSVIGKGEVMKYILQKVSMVADTQVPVLIEGETGVGKELVADLLYENSSRKGQQFVKVNCSALPRDLIEDELFGHEKGAFTSALQARKGRFEQADGGTIFLDEIGDLPLEMQPKLLRVLQDGCFERIGGQKTIQVDVRIIAATNRILQQQIQKGQFREDLYYRLNVFPITVPPLRNRKDELPELIIFFISYFSDKYRKELLQISKADKQKLIDNPWPGNVRELKNVIERSVLASQGSTLKLQWSDDYFPEAEKGSSNKSLDEVGKEYIIKILEECHWKINGDNGAAQRLAMHPNTLRSKMKKMKISRPAN